MRNLSALAIGVAVAALALVASVAAPPARAATEGPRPPFAATAATATLVVVGRAEIAADGAIAIVVDRVLQGSGPADGRLEFEAPETPPAIADGELVVVAFTDPTTIDPDAPTFAWPVSADGFIDPDGLEPAEGLPPTLAAMYTYFGVPMGAGRGSGDGSLGGDLSQALVPILLVLVALALAEAGIARRNRAHIPA